MSNITEIKKTNLQTLTNELHKIVAGQDRGISAALVAIEIQALIDARINEALKSLRCFIEVELPKG